MSTTIGSASFLWASGAALAGAASASTSRLTSAVGSGGDTFTSTASNADAAGRVSSLRAPMPFFARGNAPGGEKGKTPLDIEAIVTADMSNAGNRERLEGLITHEDMSIRWEIANILGTHEKERTAAVPLFEDMLFKMALNDPKVVVRLRAVKNLARIASFDSATNLARLIVQTSCPSTRMEALSSCLYLCSDGNGLNNGVYRDMIMMILREAQTDEAKAAINAIERATTQ